jgi:predicted GIY-YIG superfamily endonuclease
MEHYYIYCLHNENLPEYYVGHTKNLKDRLNHHKKRSKNLNLKAAHSKVYKYIRSNGGIDNFKMDVLYETYCDLEEAIKLERYYTELLGATLNTQVQGRTDKEFWQMYYENNRDKILVADKKKITCICGCTHRKRDRSKHWKTKKHINFIRENIGY